MSLDFDATQPDQPQPGPRSTADRWLHTEHRLGALADRIGVQPSTVVAAVACIVAAATASWLALRPPPLPAPETVLPPVGEVAVSLPPTTSAPPPTIVVHVAGAVQRPGVHELDASARVHDALAAAGGLDAAADESRLNLASPLRDGDRLWVPAVGETSVPDVAVGSPSTATGADPRRPVDLNVATQGELESLPGVGPAIAAAIIEHRERLGPFRSVDSLTDVTGIGPAKLDQIRPLVTV